MTLKKLIKDVLSDYKGKRFGVVAFELWGNAKDGFDCNRTFFIASDSDAEGALKAAQGRWNAFKGNYMPRARVKDIRADNPGEGILYFDCSCVPFLEIRVY
jgi:hypothetical protein